MKIIRRTVARSATAFACAWRAASTQAPDSDVGASTGATPTDDDIRDRKPTAAEIPIR